MKNELIANYSTQSIWDLESLKDEYGFDLEEVYDYWIKWNTLFVVVYKDGKQIQIAPHFDAEQDHDFIKRPKLIEIR